MRQNEIFSTPYKEQTGFQVYTLMRKWHAVPAPERSTLVARNDSAVKYDGVVTTMMLMVNDSA